MSKRKRLIIIYVLVIILSPNIARGGTGYAFESLSGQAAIVEYKESTLHIRVLPSCRDVTHKELISEGDYSEEVLYTFWCGMKLIIVLYNEQNMKRDMYAYDITNESLTKIDNDINGYRQISGKEQFITYLNYNDNLILYNINNNSTTTIDKNVEYLRPEWCQAGDCFYYANDNNILVEYSLGERSMKKLSALPKDTFRLNISPSGKYFLVSSINAPSYSMLIIDNIGRVVKDIDMHEEIILMPDEPWSPDENKLAFTLREDCEGKADILFIYDIENGTRNYISVAKDVNHVMGWNHKNGKIMYEKVDGSIWWIDPESGNEVPLWSPAAK